MHRLANQMINNHVSMEFSKIDRQKKSLEA